MKPKLGIIGQGNFGQLVGQAMMPYFQIHAVSQADDWTHAAAADYVVLAVPFDSYDEVLTKLAPLLKPSTVIVDVCSVKILPVQAVCRLLPNQPLLATHPLFGPQTAAASLVGHDIVICPQPDNADLEAKATDFFERIGLKVSVMSETEHDELMAELQGLTFFIARALVLHGVSERPIMTPSFRRLLELAELERHHSTELFATIQLANPYALGAHQAFLATATKLAASLEPNEVN